MKLESVGEIHKSANRIISEGNSSTAISRAGPDSARIRWMTQAGFTHDQPWWEEDAPGRQRRLGFHALEQQFCCPFADLEATLIDC